MKIIKRIGVFETNSSSSHSLSIKKTLPKNYSFKVKTDINKIIWFLGVVGNAYNRDKYLWKVDIVAEVDEVLKTCTEQEKADVFFVLDKLNYNRFYITQLKNELLIQFLTKQNIGKKIIENINKATPLNSKSILLEQGAKDIYALQKKLLNYLVGKWQRQEKKLLKLFSEYFQDEIYFDKFTCDRFFSHGCLVDCDCGYQGFNSSKKSLDKLKIYDIKELASHILSPKTKVVGKEFYCGLYECDEKQDY